MYHADIKWYKSWDVSIGFLYKQTFRNGRVDLKTNGNIEEWEKHECKCLQ